VSPLVERVTNAAVFASPPAQPTLDGVSRGSGRRRRSFAVDRLNGIFGSHDVTSTPPRCPCPTYTTTTQPAVFVNVSAQGDSNSIGCRIKIDDAVKDDRSVNTLNAYTYCLDKSG
jgi:Mycobacterium membrane protein